MVPEFSGIQVIDQASYIFDDGKNENILYGKINKNSILVL